MQYFNLMKILNIFIHKKLIWIYRNLYLLAWGARGREFKSHRSDQLNQGVVKNNEPAKCWFFYLFQLP